MGETLVATLQVAVAAAPMRDLEGRVLFGDVTVVVAVTPSIHPVHVVLDDADTAFAIDDEVPFELVLDTTRLDDGPHVLAAHVPAATDGRLREVARARFVVDNAAVEPRPEPPPEPTTWWRPAPGLTWYWQLTGAIDTTRDVDVYDIDYLNSSSLVARLRDAGRRVIAYVPVGDWEDYRPDSDDFPEEALCGSIVGWPERYIDVRHPTAVALIKARIAGAAARGFDGIEGDVVDLHLVDTGCATPITETEMTAFLRDLVEYSHSLGLAYFAKNAAESAATWSTFTDGVVVEEAYFYHEAAAYMPYVEAGKPVFAVEYGSGTPTDAQCADARVRNYALYGTNLALTGAVYRTCW